MRKYDDEWLREYGLFCPPLEGANLVHLSTIGL